MKKIEIVAYLPSELKDESRYSAMAEYASNMLDFDYYDISETIEGFKKALGASAHALVTLADIKDTAESIGLWCAYDIADYLATYAPWHGGRQWEYVLRSIYSAYKYIIDKEESFYFSDYEGADDWAETNRIYFTSDGKRIAGAYE